MFEVREVAIEAEDQIIAARLYHPIEQAIGLILYFHGGGWVFGGLETHDVPLRSLADLSGAAILAVDYRLGPEHPFPAAFDDCYAALR